MLHQFLIYSLLAHTLWAMPVEVAQQPHPLGDIASHIVIVTPQAQVHLEPVLKTDAPGATFIQHLTPLARFASPHEETIVYYPATNAVAAAGPLVSLEGAAITRVDTGPGQTKQYEEVLGQIQTAIQSGAAISGQQLSEAAAAAAMAAASAGSNLFPGLFPGSESKEPKPAEGSTKPALTPAATQPLITDGRSFYALTPAAALPHIIDFVHAPFAGPVLVGPVQAVRARSIASSDVPIVALPIPEAPKPEALPLSYNNKKKTELKENKETKKIETEKEKEKLKSNEFGRFLEADALKEPQIGEQKFEENFKKEDLKAEKEIATDRPEESELTDKVVEDFTQIQTKAAVDAVATDELPQSKVA